MQVIIEYLSKIPWQILIIFSAIGVATGDYFAKYWSINQKTIFYFIAILGYVVSGFFYLPTLLQKGLIVTSLAWALLSIILFLFIGLVIFKETLTTFQVIGLILGIIALIILSI